MEIFKLLQSHPLNGIALLVALCVIVWCIFLLRKVRGLHNRTLTGLVGMTAVFQGLRLLQGTGLLPEGSRTNLDDFVNLLVTGIYLASLFALRGLSRESTTNAMALRLAESNQAKPLQHPHVAPISLRPVRPNATLAGSGSSSGGDDLSRVVLDAAPIPMFAVGLDGNVNYWNRAAEQALGWSKDEVMGQKLPNLVLQPGDPFSMEDGPIRLVRKDGAPVDQSIRSVPLRDSRGTLNGILTIVSA
jgi:PAS domain S-box-containing protein